MKRQSAERGITAADVAGLRDLLKRTDRLESKRSPELLAVRGQVKAALTSGDHLGNASHCLSIARRSLHGPDPEAALHGVIVAAEELAALMGEIQRFTSSATKPAA